MSRDDTREQKNPNPQQPGKEGFGRPGDQKGGYSNNPKEDQKSGKCDR